MGDFSLVCGREVGVVSDDGDVDDRRLSLGRHQEIGLPESLRCRDAGLLDRCGAGIPEISLQLGEGSVVSRHAVQMCTGARL